MASKKLSHYLYKTNIIIKCDNAPLCKFLTADTLNLKVNNWGTEIASMSHVTFEHIIETANILADHIYRLTSMGLYDMFDPEEGGKEFGHFMFDESAPSLQLNKKGQHYL